MAIVELPAPRGWSRDRSGLYTLNRDSPQAQGLANLWPLDAGPWLTDLVTGQRIASPLQPGVAYAAGVGSVQANESTNASVVTGLPALSAPWTALVWFQRSPTTSHAGQLTAASSGYKGSLRTNQYDASGAIGFSSGTGVDFNSSYQPPTTRMVPVVWVQSLTDMTVYAEGAVIATFATGGSILERYRLFNDSANFAATRGQFAHLVLWSRALSQPEALALYDPSTRWDLYQQASRRTYFTIGGGASTAVASAAGVATVAGVGASTAASVAAAIGIGAVAALGASVATAVSSAAGAATATSIGEAAFTGVAAAAGIATATGVGAGTAASVAAGDGTATASGVGIGAAEAVGAADGVAVGTGVGLSTAVADAAAAGIATGAGVGASTAAAEATATGATTAAGYSDGTVPADAAAAGTSTAAAIGVAAVLGVGASSGAATVAAVGASTFTAVGVSAGVAAAAAFSLSTAEAVWAATGSATAAGISEGGLVLLPTNIIKATQTVVQVQRRIAVTHPKRTVTFDG